jgi:hypothetical protein
MQKTDSARNKKTLTNPLQLALIDLPDSKSLIQIHILQSCHSLFSCLALSL